MRTVVIYTGALRTIKKTIRHFQRNVLQNGVDVFVCVQNDTSQPDTEWDAWFQEKMGSSLRGVQWYSAAAYPDWSANRDRQIGWMTIEDSWKSYLRTSGSMIEYFQLQLAYMAMVKYELQNGFRYDYLIRGRTDTIFAKPVDFHWLRWTESEVAIRMNRVREELRWGNMDQSDRNVLMYFMSTVWSDDVLPNLERIFADYRPCEAEMVLEGDLTAARLHAYLQRGRYLLTLRKNNLYAVRRSLFYLIPSLGTFYGFLRAPDSDPWWYNAEGQFRDACYYSGITVFDYSTLYEEKSLEYASQWNEADFFDMDFNLLNPRMLYCVVRK